METSTDTKVHKISNPEKQHIQQDALQRARDQFKELYGCDTSYGSERIKRLAPEAKLIKQYIVEVQKIRIPKLEQQETNQLQSQLIQAIYSANASCLQSLNDLISNA